MIAEALPKEFENRQKKITANLGKYSVTFSKDAKEEKLG